MNQEHQIVRQVQKAQGDSRAADQLIRQYLPFIKSETARFLKRPPDENQDELVTLLEEDVPLAALPKTGHNNSNVLWLLFSGLMLGAFTITGKKKEEQ